MTASYDVSDLAGRGVVVAGASRGIGLAVARLFADEGAHVHAISRDRTALRDAVASQSTGASITAHEADATDAAQVAAVAATICEADEIHVVVSTVGANIPERRLSQLTAASWDQMVASNLNSAFYLLSSFLSALRTASGVFIGIGSASAVWPNFSGAAYQASKVGLFGLTRAASLEEHHHGLRFTVISPGLVNTEHLTHRPKPPSDEALEDALRPVDVAAACRFVATLPPRVHVPELVLLPTALQAPGQTEIPSAPA